MSKQRTKTRKRPFPAAPAKPVAKKRRVSSLADSQPKHRDGIEQLVIAIILAVLFRSFEAEAFIIPTGSMAPSLQGRHKDVKCPECKYRYRTGVADFEPTKLHCPSCGYVINALGEESSNPPTFSGDRILVNKFAYQLGDPQRWDVIVFKNPGNAKQNYIKRLVGLPNETIRIRHGDVYSSSRAESESGFEILRKPTNKVRAMLHFVHDTHHIPAKLADSNWPTRWFDPQVSTQDAESGWKTSEDRATYNLASATETCWLQYRHLPPADEDWRDIEKGKPVDPGYAGQLITDDYAYNVARGGRPIWSGWHWVGDLAVEADLRIDSNTGQLILELIEGGHHFAATVDVVSGEVELTIDQGAVPFEDASTVLSAKTSINGPGRHKVMFANVDDRLLLWVDGRLIQFGDDKSGDGGACYALDTSMPRYSEEDPGDLNPVRIGGRDLDVEIRRLRVMRDMYYIACKSEDSYRIENDYRTDAMLFTPADLAFRRPEQANERVERRMSATRAEIAELMRTPGLWSSTNWFESRATVEFELGDEQYFPMGDNAPRSQDARLWAGRKRRVFLNGRPKDFPGDYPVSRMLVGHFVPRSQLIGKAFLIYWPHGWPVAAGRLPIIPNVQRMGRIK